mmetsp:Transcript_35103/g.48970  ORF Transcript_35103/g.48970 Transcript_35103/m.48970 type:complete len:203 (+) Transcript_35103:68-676(+)
MLYQHYYICYASSLSKNSFLKLGLIFKVLLDLIVDSVSQSKRAVLGESGINLRPVQPKFSHDLVDFNVIRESESFSFEALGLGFKGVVSVSDLSGGGVEAGLLVDSLRGLLPVQSGVESTLEKEDVKILGPEVGRLVFVSVLSQDDLSDLIISKGVINGSHKLRRVGLSADGGSLENSQHSGREAIRVRGIVFLLLNNDRGA